MIRFGRSVTIHDNAGSCPVPNINLPCIVWCRLVKGTCSARHQPLPGILFAPRVRLWNIQSQIAAMWVVRLKLLNLQIIVRICSFPKCYYLLSDMPCSVRNTFDVIGPPYRKMLVICARFVRSPSDIARDLQEYAHDRAFGHTVRAGTLYLRHVRGDAYKMLSRFSPLPLSLRASKSGPPKLRFRNVQRAGRFQL